MKDLANFLFFFYIINKNLFFTKNVKISGNEYYQDDKRCDVAQVELNNLVLWELDSFTGICFGNEAVPAPALLNCTEEEE